MDMPRFLDGHPCIEELDAFVRIFSEQGRLTKRDAARVTVYRAKLMKGAVLPYASNMPRAFIYQAGRPPRPATDEDRRPPEPVFDMRTRRRE